LLIYEEKALFIIGIYIWFHKKCAMSRTSSPSDPILLHVKRQDIQDGDHRSQIFDNFHKFHSYVR
jgi:hypothetical protein